MEASSMADHPRRARLRPRFRLRTLLGSVAGVAMLLAAAGPLYYRFTSFPLSQAVNTFNTRDAYSELEHGAPLTEDEVVAAIEAQLYRLDTNPEIKRTFQRIARTRRLPEGATFDRFPVVRTAAAKGVARVEYWCINLSVMTGPDSGYGLRVRETVPSDEPGSFSSSRASDQINSDSD